MCLVTDSFKASNTKQLSSWIVVSRATNHMIHNVTFFDSYKPILGSQNIIVADGSPTNIVGQDSLHIAPLISLKNMLHIPKPSTNQISIHKIAKELHCKVIFFLFTLCLLGSSLREDDWIC